MGQAPVSRRDWGAGVASAAAVIAVITALSRIVGFGRWIVSAWAVGPGCVGDVYAAANQIPNVLYEVLAGGALSAAIVPVVAPMVQTGDTERIRQTVSALLTWAVAVTVPVALLLGLLAGPLGELIAPARCAATQGTPVTRLGTWMLWVFAIQVVLYAVGMVATGALQAHRRFWGPALAPLASSAVVIVALVGVRLSIDGHQDDVTAMPAAARNWLGWGTTAGVVALSLPLLLPLRRLVPGLAPRWRFPAGVAAQVRTQAAAGVLALLAQQVFVVTTLALTRSGAAGVGALPILQYTQAVVMLPFAVLVVPLVTSAFPALSHQDDPDALAALCARTLRTTLLVGLIGAAALLAAAPALEAFFTRVDGSGRGVPGMARAVAIMAVGLPGLAILTQAARTLQARRRARQAAVGTTVAWLLAAGVALAAVALGIHPLTALTAGNTAGMTLGAGLLLSGLVGAVGRAGVQGCGRVAVPAVAAAGGLGGAGWWAVQALLGDDPSMTRALMTGGIGAGLATAAMMGLAVALEPALRNQLRGLGRIAGLRRMGARR